MSWFKKKAHLRSILSFEFRWRAGVGRDDGKLQNRIRIGRGQHAVEFRQILHDCERFAKFHKRRFISWRILQLRLGRHSYELWTDCRTVGPNSAARKQKGNMLTEQIE